MKRLPILFAFLLLFYALPAHAAAWEITVGQYVLLGRYQGSPILWRCVGANQNGPLMLSDKILCLKAFDAAGSHQNDSSGDRSSAGSNAWEGSNLDAWLNSEAAQVQWPCGNPPAVERMANGQIGYDSEPGFLNGENFTDTEKQAIKTVSYRTLLNVQDKAAAQTGSAPHNYRAKPSELLQNQAESYAKQVSGRVFLPGVSEIASIYQNIGRLGIEYHLAKPTPELAENAPFPLSPDKNWGYWLRDPLAYSRNGQYVREVYSDASVSYASANNDAIGVRPAFYLNTESAALLNGDGTKESPFTADSVPYLQVRADLPSADLPAGSAVSLQIISKNLPSAAKILLFQKGSLLGEVADSYEYTVQEGGNALYAKAYGDQGALLYTSDILSFQGIAYQPRELLLSTGFEGADPYGGFSGHGLGDGSMEPRIVDAEHGKSLRIQSDGATSPYLIFPGLSARDSGFLITEAEFRFMDLTARDILPFKTQPGSVWLRLLRMTKEGAVTLALPGGGTQTLIDKAILGRWYRFRLIMDLEQKTVTVQVNGTCLAAQIPFYYQDYSCLDYLNVNAGGVTPPGRTVMYVDNLAQYTAERAVRPLARFYSGGREIFSVEEAAGDVSIKVTAPREAGNFLCIAVVTAGGVLRQTKLLEFRFGPEEAQKEAVLSLPFEKRSALQIYFWEGLNTLRPMFPSAFLNE